ncbi:MAG: hypothetical protein HDR17_06040 [Lachnospiraceae bacterium]|nr:hypothetical protein [Lachnospiraceae bacterium]
MSKDITEIKEHIELYFKEHLPQYTVLAIRRKSSHPDDKHLRMASAKKSTEKCEKIFEEYYFS